MGKLIDTAVRRRIRRPVVLLPPSHRPRSSLRRMVFCFLETLFSRSEKNLTHHRKRTADALQLPQECPTRPQADLQSLCPAVKLADDSTADTPMPD